MLPLASTSSILTSGRTSWFTAPWPFGRPAMYSRYRTSGTLNRTHMTLLSDRVVSTSSFFTRLPSCLYRRSTMPSVRAVTTVNSTSRSAVAAFAFAFASRASASPSSRSDTTDEPATFVSYSRLVLSYSSCATLTSAISASHRALYSVGTTLNSGCLAFTACPSLMVIFSRYPSWRACTSMCVCEQIWQTYFCVFVTFFTSGVVSTMVCFSSAASASCFWQAGRTRTPTKGRTTSRRDHAITGFTRENLTTVVRTRRAATRTCTGRAGRPSWTTPGARADATHKPLRSSVPAGGDLFTRG